MGGSLAWRGTRTGNTQSRKRSIASMYPSGQLLGSFNEEIYVTQHDEVSLASPGANERGLRTTRQIARNDLYIASTY